MSRIGGVRRETKMWLLLIAVLIGATVGGYVLYFKLVLNPRAMEELRTNPSGVRAAEVMLLTFPGGKVLPVNYLREGNTVYAGADFGWWKAFVPDGAPVQLLIQGENLNGHARVILDDPAFTHEIFARLRPTVPAWLPDWLNGKLVVIELDR